VEKESLNKKSGFLDGSDKKKKKTPPKKYVMTYAGIEPAIS
jgi:hypothetical protein